MEYIMINESKLKVICEESDLDPYGICADSLEYGDAYSRKFLEDLLDEAKVRFGFDTARHRVLIQLFPDNEGGCEIFINKLGLLEKQSCDTKKQENTSKKPKNKILKKLFFFERLDFMIEVCKRLSFLDGCKSSTAFYEEGHGYYLYFDTIVNAETEEYGLPTLDEYSFLLEYGEAQSSKEKLPYLYEYAKNICSKNAIEELGKI